MANDAANPAHSSAALPPAAVLAEVERLGSRMGAVRGQIARSIIGQQAVVEQSLVVLLSGGHALLVGVPGLGKSRLVETLALVLGLATKRVQFTPDLMPADIIGSEVLEEQAGGRRGFRFVPGPVFCQLLMADEINRASPRTQSALLQAMQEQRVAIGGTEYALPQPFHVLATQNPIEQEGTYPLPEAQLDRFLLQIDVGYPALAEERTMLLATTGARAGHGRAGPVTRGIAARAASHPPDPGRQPGGRCDPGAGARGAARDRQRRGGAPARRLGTGAACGTGADAGDAGARGAGRKAVAQHRRRGRPRPRGAAAPHGPGLLGARRGRAARRPSWQGWWSGCRWIAGRERRRRVGRCLAGAGAGCAFAAAAGRRRAHCRHRGARRAWQASRRPGRQFLAIPPAAARRTGDAHRLAAVGAQRPGAFRPPDRMGGGADGCAVACLRGGDALAQPARSAGEADARGADPAGARSAAAARRRAGAAVAQGAAGRDRAGGTVPARRRAGRDPVRGGRAA